MKYNVGIDLGGTNIVAAVVDENAKILSKVKCKTNLPKAPDILCDDIKNLITEAIFSANLKLSDIDIVGIGSPGIINNKTGYIEYSCNFDYHNVPIRELLESRIGKKVYIENDANAAAIGEFAFGAGKDVSSMVAITLGTGVGGGIIIDSKIYCGFNYAAGELGHMVIEKDGRPCSCGRKGCFETYSSATGLILTTKEIMNENKDSLMWNISKEDGKINGKTAFLAMKQGDKAAKLVVDRYIDYLACGIINLINIFSVPLISIGGGISNEKEALLNPLLEVIKKEAYSKDSENNCQIVIAELSNDAGLIGASVINKYQ